ncbi:MAG: capsular polysaccharide synthesis protein [Acinetobacter populi]|jgi:hypothetical protein|uniref:glycosyltransferase family 32 protein n=1 Tax=Acinetobacter populi TaxID=1582270 RepID=UPI00235348DE|nr:capsular polysaccharide synthesis protein [Acinetobacter populi]MCH4249001.1 capsular polysaccharide synthesis protein [Acinetobacter populi]
MILLNILKKPIKLLLCIFRLFFQQKNVEGKWIRLSETEHKNLSHNTHQIPKIIWMYWDSKEKNELVDLCISSVRHHCIGYDIRVLDSTNVEDYINLPKLNKILKPAIIADYIRLSLLKKYGGIWMDASIFLTTDFDWFLSKMDGDTIFLFYSDACTINLNKPILENWFIAANPSNDFICDWFNEFEKCISSKDPTQYYSEYADKKDIIQKIPNTDYLMCYISAAIVLSKKSYNILTLNSGSQGHYYNYRFFSNSFFIALVLGVYNKNNIFKPKLIKFTKDTRKYSNIFLENNLVLTKSLLNKSSLIIDKRIV